jgi:segregation and condensation protein A
MSARRWALNTAELRTGMKISPVADAGRPAVQTRIALVNGEPMMEVPEDLYIPPEALEIFLDTFEGPLDLLLYLIRKADFNVLDIPMAVLTRQYLEYVEKLRERHLELAAEYLLMAALLIEIKSRMLLPRHRHEEATEEDPRAELVRRLLEYEAMKRAALQLDELPRAGRDFDWVQVWIEQAAAKRLPDVGIADLTAAWRALLVQARVNQHHRISRKELSVREHMSRILRRLRGAGFVEFAQLFEPSAGVSVLVVHFLALLELAREALVEVTQEKPYAPIYVRLTHAEPE